MTILLVYQNKASFEPFVKELEQQENITLVTAETGAEALDILQKVEVDAVIADQELSDTTGLDLIKELVQRNPFVNTVLVSDLPGKDFHEVTEGLGVLMPLPSALTKEHVQTVLAKLAKVASLI